MCFPRIEKYFSIPHHYVPLLRPRQDFLLNLPTTQFLTTSLLALASRYSYRSSFNDYRELALSQASVTQEATERPIEFAQAMILLTYLEYGLGNVTNAAKLNKQTIDHVLLQGWHTMDQADGPACHDTSIGSAGGLISLGRPGWNGLGDEPGVRAAGVSNGTQGYVDGRCEERRRIVWELWIQDLLLSITSGMPRHLAQSEFAVHFPRDPSNPAFPSVRVAFGFQGTSLTRSRHRCFIHSGYALSCTWSTQWHSRHAQPLSFEKKTPKSC
jgi:hypothetical protein